MYFWFQNLNENLKKLFHFRGSVGRAYNKQWFSYELCSGRSFAFEITHGEAGDQEATRLRVGCLFFDLYLKFRLPSWTYFKRKCIATWDNNREFYLVQGRHYGFYFYDWAFVWNFHAKVFESSSSDPWWMRQYIHIDDFFLGRPELLTDDLMSAEDIYFKMGTKEFKIDSIKWERCRRFRRHIPYSLYHQTWYRVEIKIDQPPMRAGKGENSWDCGDDGIFGMSREWQGTNPNYLNYDQCIKEAVQLYVESVTEDAKRYGGSDSDRGVRADFPFEYIGRKINKDEGSQVNEKT